MGCAAICSSSRVPRRNESSEIQRWVSRNARGVCALAVANMRSAQQYPLLSAEPILSRCATNPLSGIDARAKQLVRTPGT